MSATPGWRNEASGGGLRENGAFDRGTPDTHTFSFVLMPTQDGRVSVSAILSYTHTIVDSHGVYPGLTGLNKIK